MLDSLARIDRFQRKMDRLLPEEPEPVPEEPQAAGATEAWSPWSVLHEYRDDPVGFFRLLGYEVRWALDDVPLELGCRAELPDGRVGTVYQLDGGADVGVRLDDDGADVLVPPQGVKRLCDYQEQVARALVADDQVAVKSGQKTGKTLLAVLLAIWWCCTRPRGRVTCTSASFDLVKDPLWVEVWNVYRTTRARGIEWLPQPNMDPKTGWRWPDGRSIRGISVDKPEAAAGKSGDEQLFILDEASGIIREIAEAFLGNAMGGGKVLALSNPTQTDGFFYDCFTRARAFWRLFTLSGTETPNYLAGKALVPGLALRATIEERRRRYGEKSPWFLIRVLGEFPSQTPDAVIGVGHVEAALGRWGTIAEPLGVLELGVDVALYGDDDSAIAAKRGKVLISPDAVEGRTGVRAVVNGYDHLEVAGLVLRVMRALRQPGERVQIKIDAGGGYGSAVATELRAQQESGAIDDGVDIIEINVAWSPVEKDKYPQLRDELWFGMRDFLKEGGVLAPDPELEAELVAPKYTTTRKGQLKVDDKPTIKKAIQRSPNRADAVGLAIYAAPANDDDLSVGGYAGGRRF